MKISIMPEPTLWTRGAGTAKIEDERIVLNKRLGLPYWIMDAGQLIFDLAVLPRPLTATHALRFAQQYGLLRHSQYAPQGTEGDGSGDPEADVTKDMTTQVRHLEASPSNTGEAFEAFADWEPISQSLDYALTLYAALPMKGEQAAASRSALKSALQNYGENNKVQTEETLCDVAAARLSRVVAEGLRNVEIQFVARGQLPALPRLDPRLPAPERESRLFFCDAKTECLAGCAYFQLSKMMLDQTPIRRCVQCNRYFVVTYKSMQFCSTLCGTKARMRRYRQNQADSVMRGQDGVTLIEFQADIPRK